VGLWGLPPSCEAASVKRGDSFATLSDFGGDGLSRKKPPSLNRAAQLVGHKSFHRLSTPKSIRLRTTPQSIK
jgi:hypothetical protein